MKTPKPKYDGTTPINKALAELYDVSIKSNNKLSDLSNEYKKHVGMHHQLRLTTDQDRLGCYAYHWRKKYGVEYTPPGSAVGADSLSISTSKESTVEPDELSTNTSNEREPTTDNVSTNTSLESIATPDEVSISTSKESVVEPNELSTNTSEKRTRSAKALPIESPYKYHNITVKIDGKRYPVTLEYYWVETLMNRFDLASTTDVRIWIEQHLPEMFDSSDKQVVRQVKRFIVLSLANPPKTGK